MHTENSARVGIYAPGGSASTIYIPRGPRALYVHGFSRPGYIREQPGDIGYRIKTDAKQDLPFARSCAGGTRKTCCCRVFSSNYHPELSRAPRALLESISRASEKKDIMSVKLCSQGRLRDFFLITLPKNCVKGASRKCTL